ncbi:FAD-dependent oxidoreductase [Enterovirga sp.]|uniref:flavin monoamine oxidase family protein n=1 Tax=Enterovirga sp. TaxID=2026350 RepID=UPI00260FFADC|nr:FAD-dependent oxidoreductase [Enterovirga sp.]MDB5589779.1 amine oxidase [Enterovirga sp.]
MSLVAPIFRAVQAPATRVDVAIVGAGAAGVAAARHCLAAGLSVAVLESRDRVGGRAVTASFAGHAVDLGAHWLHAGSVNPLVRLGRERGEAIWRAPRETVAVLDGRVRGRTERRRHGQAFARADRAFAEAARDATDRSLASALPLLGRWRDPAAATFALISGRPLDEVSVKDFPSDEFGDNHFIRGGYGSYLARLACGLPVALGTPVSAVELTGAGVQIQSGRGVTQARAAIVTAPVAVLAAGVIRFAPALPADLAEAIASFLPGTYEHVVLNWPDAPFRAPDRLAKLVSRRGSVGMLTRIDGSPYHYLELDHARVLGARRRAGGLGSLARSILAEQFGPGSLRRMRVVTATDWTGDPWARAAWAVAPPGRAPARRRLRVPVEGRIWFAGEAADPAMWGTVGGAWASGSDAAAEVVASLRPGS